LTPLKTPKTIRLAKKSNAIQKVAFLICCESFTAKLGRKYNQPKSKTTSGVATMPPAKNKLL